MKIKGLIEEDFTNYKKTAMFIIFPVCDFKCDRESNIQVCQNSSLSKLPSIEVSIDLIVSHYINNPISHAIVCGGLEPFNSWSDLIQLITEFRNQTQDDIVIYTGYYKNEISEKLEILKQFPNIIIKFGRFIPGHQKHFDEVLGIYLASDNQYAEKIS